MRQLIHVPPGIMLMCIICVALGIGEQALGGTYLFKLQPTASSQPLEITTTWGGMDGKPHRHQQQVDLAAVGSSAIGVRKAVALVQFVDLQERYCVKSIVHWVHPSIRRNFD